jgi:hypothetical protein
LLQLWQNGFVEVAGGDRKNGYNYQITDGNEYESLKGSIEEVLSEAVKNLGVAQ